MKDAYAVATVVGREPPVSSHLGDRATIRADGRLEGFIGGSCSREIVRRQALQTLHTGEPRLVRIRPDAREMLEERDVVTVPMTCISEGAVDVYIEPHLPRRALFIAGFTPVAHALAQLAPSLDFEVVRFVDSQEWRDAEYSAGCAVVTIDLLEGYLQEIEPGQRERAVAIVASQGHYDERALSAFLRHGAGFVGLLASPKRAAAIRDVLLQEGVPAERVSAVHNPVGLAIGARKPAEVAVSILAEIVADASSAAERGKEPAPADLADSAVDPVCGMTVEIAAAQHRADFEGSTYYFCCPHCRASFMKHPEQYLAAATP
jgi:xanthine dehydrogenase accessory factor